MKTSAALGEITVRAEDDPAAVWERIRALAAAGGLPPLDAARLALAALELVGRPATTAVVEVAAVSGEDSAEVEAVVSGGTGDCDGLAGRLADACRPRAAVSGAAGPMVAVTAGQQARSRDTDPALRALLAEAAERGGLAALLSAALIALEDQPRLGADYRTEVWQLRAELDATSQGLLALHAELSDQRDQLEKAQAAAEAASQAKAAFLASMSHEIRSSLNAVIGFTSLLQETGLTAEQTEYTETLAAAGGHLKDLVDGILDLSKVESGQLELEEIPFDLMACVEDAAGLVAPQAEGKHLALATLINPGVPPTVSGDPLRLRQILVNLLSNAVKFTDCGQVTIEVAAQSGAGEGECLVLFDVQDTGPGIPAAALGRLFDPFTQADVSTSRRFGGTGLGLAICKQLTERMGGQVTVASATGLGSTFTAAIPFRQAEPAAPGEGRGAPGEGPGAPGEGPGAAGEGPGAAGEGPDRVLSGVHVLLVHPQPIVIDAARRHLAAWGAAVTVGSSAADAARHSAEWADAALAVVGTSQPADLIAAVGTLTAAHGGQPLPVVGLTPLTWGPAPPSFPVAWTVAATPIRRARLREAVLGALGHPEQPSRADPATHASGPVRSLHVLVAEDDPVNQRAITLVLHRLGHRVDLAGDGEEAVAAISRGGYDVVLMDVHMPRLDGIAATRQIRAQHPGPKPPIIALTASATPGTRQECLSAGMTGFLTKPVQPADLADMIASATQRPGPAGDLPSESQRSPGLPSPSLPSAGQPSSGLPSADLAAPQAAATRTVLYIDDEPALRGLVERILTKDPALVVLTAADAGTGAELALTRRPDLILLDLHLGGVSGEALIKDLRAGEHTSTIPIVVVSGDTSPQTVKRLTGLGVAAHLAKPFDADRLRATIAAVTQRPGPHP